MRLARRFVFAFMVAALLAGGAATVQGVYIDCNWAICWPF